MQVVEPHHLQWRNEDRTRFLGGNRYGIHGTTSMYPTPSTMSVWIAPTQHHNHPLKRGLRQLRCSSDLREKHAARRGAGIYTITTMSPASCGSHGRLNGAAGMRSAIRQGRVLLHCTFPIEPQYDRSKPPQRLSSFLADVCQYEHSSFRRRRRAINRTRCSDGHQDAT